jgi:hypothetical protein
MTEKKNEILETEVNETPVQEVEAASETEAQEIAEIEEEEAMAEAEFEAADAKEAIETLEIAEEIVAEVKTEVEAETAEEVVAEETTEVEEEAIEEVVAEEKVEVVTGKKQKPQFKPTSAEPEEFDWASLEVGLDA